jgi:hypothetical protein
MLNISLDHNTKVAEVKAFGQFRPSFGEGLFKIYMCASVPHVQRVGTFVGRKLDQTSMSKKGDYFDGSMGTLMEFDEESLNREDRIVQSRVGVSWKSVEQACRYAENEVPDWRERAAFERVRLASRTRWNQIMGDTFKPSLKGVSLEQRVR